MLKDVMLTKEEKEKMEQIERRTVDDKAAIGHRRYVVVR